MSDPVRPRRPSRQVTGDDQRRPRRSTPGTTCSASSRACSASRPGHTNDAGWSQVAAVRGDGATIYATILGSPSRTQRNADLADAARLGPRPVPAGRRDRPASGATPTVELAVRPRRRSPLVAARSRCGTVVRLGQAAHRSGSSRRPSVVAAGAARAGRSDASQIWAGDAAARLARRSSRPARSRGRASPGRIGWYASAYSPQRRSASVSPPMIVTVTLNAAIDRTITVPNFQRGQRHRASAGLAARRRQGDQRRPRAEGARRPGRRHRPRRRADRACGSSSS